jgi:hypothetical protein
LTAALLVSKTGRLQRFDENVAGQHFFFPSQLNIDVIALELTQLDVSRAGKGFVP